MIKIGQASSLTIPRSIWVRLLLNVPNDNVVSRLAADGTSARRNGHVAVPATAIDSQKSNAV
jgi:hypothetical protein